MKKTNFFYLALICLTLITGKTFAQAVGDYGSNASGNWTTAATWVVCVTPGTWSGATTATLATAATTNVWIRAGHTVIFDTSSKLCNNLTIENGGTLYCNTANTSPKYLKVYGSTITNNGTLGGTADALSIGLYGTTPQTLTLTGSGTYGISRIQPTIVSPTIIIDANVLVTYAGSGGAGGSSIYNNGIDNFTLTVNTGKTLTTAGLSYISIATSGSTVPSTGYNITLNINGTLTTGTNGHINLLNASSKTSTINIGSQGILNCGGNLLMPAAASTGTFSIATGGVLNINTGSIFKIGGTVTTLTNNGSVNVNGSFQIDEGVTASGNNFAYGAAGTLILNNALPNYTVSGSPLYWPITNGPVNLTVQNTGGVQMQVPRTLTGTTTVSAGSTLKTGANTFTNNGTANINGTFQIDEGGWATGTNFVYGTAGTLVFNNSTGFYGVSGTPVFWPASGGPVNVTVQNTGGIEMQIPRTVTGIFQTATGVKNTFGNDLTVSGTVRLNAGGYFGNFSPTYSGTAILEYNTGSTYGVYNEWGAGSSVGYGVPKNVSVLNSTAVNLSGARSIPGTLNLTSGKLSLGANDLTIGTAISGGSATSYIVTDGVGKVTVPAASAVATLIPVGASASSYDPVSVTPATATTFAVKAYATLSGTAPYGVRYNPKEWDITPTLASSTLIALTPSNLVESVTSPVIGHYVGVNYVNSTATMTNSNTTFTGTFDTFSPFVTGANVDVTAITNGDKNNVNAYTKANHLIVTGTLAGDIISVYGLNGQTIANVKAITNQTIINLNKGLYLVNVKSTDKSTDFKVIQK